MKKSLCIAAIYLVTTLSVARAADKSFTGEIMDSQCADMGTHDHMMKGERASNAKDCAIACVKKGGTFALYDASAKKTYRLDNQKKAREFGGQKVTVNGKLDAAGETIQVASIQPGS